MSEPRKPLFQFYHSLNRNQRITLIILCVIALLFPFLLWSSLRSQELRSRAQVPATPPTDPNPTPTPTPQPTLPLPIVQNFESGFNGWATSGLWYLAGSETGCPNAYNGNVSAYFGKAPGCTYDVGIAKGELTSPYFTIPANAMSASLNFYGWYETESTGTTYDRRLIEVKETGAIGWLLAQQLSADTMRQWNLYTVNLNAYIGKTIQVRFRFDSMDSYANAYKGWYVDAITIEAATPTPTPTPTSTPTPTPTPSPTPTPITCNQADINKDGTVDGLDYSILIENFFLTKPATARADIDGDGIVDMTDYSILVSQFGTTTGSCL